MQKILITHSLMLLFASPLAATDFYDYSGFVNISGKLVENACIIKLDNNPQPILLNERISNINSMTTLNTTGFISHLDLNVFNCSSVKNTIHLTFHGDTEGEMFKDPDFGVVRIVSAYGDPVLSGKAMPYRASEDNKMRFQIHNIKSDEAHHVGKDISTIHLEVGYY